jgi:hypothetical protein
VDPAGVPDFVEAPERIDQVSMTAPDSQAALSFEWGGPQIA